MVEETVAHETLRPDARGSQHLGERWRALRRGRAHSERGGTAFLWGHAHEELSEHPTHRDRLVLG